MAAGIKRYQVVILGGMFGLSSVKPGSEEMPRRSTKYREGKKLASTEILN
jgi:hypothetical protein